MLEYLTEYWGLLYWIVGLVLALLGVEYLLELDWVKKKAVELIFIAEEHGRKGALETGKEKFEWVKKEGYRYLPPFMKIILSEEAYGILVQTIFDRLKKWAKDKGLL